jgi:alkaline phosphatase
VLGLFNNDHLTFEVDRDPAAEPALARPCPDAGAR